MNDKVLWLTFIFNEYAKSKKTSIQNAFRTIRSSGALNYLLQTYDVEHLQNPVHTLRHIDQFAQMHQLPL
jgi:hypothetical protein